MKFRFFILTLVLCLLPAAALAAIEPANGVSKEGSTITLSGDNEEYTISNHERGVSIIVESGVKTITLNGATISGPEDQAVLTAKGDLELVLIGKSTIEGANKSVIGANDHVGQIYGGNGIVLPFGNTLTISGDGSLNVTGGYAQITTDTSKAGHASAGVGITGNVKVESGTLTVSGGDARSTAMGRTIGGAGITGNVKVESGTLTATGGMADGIGSNAVTGGAGVGGDAMVTGGTLTATGGKGQHTGNYKVDEIDAGAGVGGNATVTGGTLTATGGNSEVQTISTVLASTVGGAGVGGNATVTGGTLTVTGGDGKNENGRLLMNNGVKGTFTAEGGSATITAGTNGAYRDKKYGQAVGSETATIGAEGKEISLSRNDGPGGEPYTEPTSVNAKSDWRLATREVVLVTYTCDYEGCEAIAEREYADIFQLYSVKTNPSTQHNHGGVFAYYADAEGNQAAEKIQVSSPTTLYAKWKMKFTFNAGEGGTGEMAGSEVIISSNRITLPECEFSPSEGYRFLGWRIEGDENIYGEGVVISSTAREIKLTAVWELIPVPTPVPPETGDDSDTPELPQTGDSAMPALWLLLCLGSCIMLWLLGKKAKN